VICFFDRVIITLLLVSFTIIYAPFDSVGATLGVALFKKRTKRNENITRRKLIKKKNIRVIE
jgi:hypothetical protein